ncbi:MAG: family 20 glycosylhydrolase, partial [Lentisphaerota bacterium]
MKGLKKARTMNACNFIFPPPQKCILGKTAANISRELRLNVEKVPEESLQALYQILKRRRLRVSNDSGTMLRCEITGNVFRDIKNESIRKQAYLLEITEDGRIILQAADIAGIKYGIITLSEIFAAAAKGALINACMITDFPAFAVRGVQIDMAREFFPSLPYLKKIVDRLEKMKANTLWLYIENRFQAKGMKDIAPAYGMTAAIAGEISEYALARGIDVVPGINVLSHMEGWFRLQRYSEFCDGDSRSYPVLTKPEPLKLVFQYIDSMIEAFPSKNFHAGLDELLFTETNPEAAEAIKKLGKADYFANFAIKVIKHIQKKGKTVWMWDDMVLGKNIYRKEGFNDTYRQALDKIPDDVIMTHWYYWTNADGKHTDIIKRVTESGRPFVVAPSSLGQRSDYTAFDKTLELQAYIAECGFKYGAFGFINTHWESRKGHFFESLWPHLAVSSAFAWYGPEAGNTVFFAESFSFNLTGDTGNTLMKYLEKMSMIDSFLDNHGIGNGKLRYDLYCRGPHFLWRFC